MPLKIYIVIHALLAASLIGSAILRNRKKEPLIYFANDALYLLLGFLFIGGGAMLAVRALPGL